jgi:hypothetical protein
MEGGFGIKGRGRGSRSVGAALPVAVAMALAPASAQHGVTAEQVERAIEDGVSYLNSKRRRRLVERRRPAVLRRYDGPGHAGLADRRRAAG